VWSFAAGQGGHQTGVETAVARRTLADRTDDFDEDPHATRADDQNN
jgi:hypothetical protein